VDKYTNFINLGGFFQVIFTFNYMKKIIVNLVKLPSLFVIFLIKAYQFLFSFDHAFWAKYSPIRVCIHQPSCSEFAVESIQRFGLIKGSIMGFFRILRCNGFSKGGYDPVPNKFSIKPNYNNENENFDCKVRHT